MPNLPNCVYQTCTTFTLYQLYLNEAVKKKKRKSCKEDVVRVYTHTHTHTHTHAIEYYSAVKKNEVMPFAVIWMDLEIFIQVK